jgi:predicted TPR repeat methyltransferase
MAAVRCHEAGQLQEAAARYEQLLQREPHNPVLLHLFGVLAFQCGQPSEALDRIGRAIALDPAQPLFHSNLANVLKSQGRAQEALESFRRALELDPGFAEAHYNLALLLEELGRLEESERSYRDAIRNDPALHQAHNNLGSLLKRRGAFPQALDSFRNALKLAPDCAPYQASIEHTLQAIRECAQIIEKYREAARARPDDAVNEFNLAAVTGEQTPATAPRSFTVQLFDGYAEHFDSHLVGILDYRVPERLCEVIGRLRPLGSLDVLDLGCGTGRCGVVFRRLARTMAGVDLSPKMIERARDTGAYDALWTEDLLVPLSQAQSAFDLIVAADVFIYVGDLEPLFQAARRALRPHGLLAFSIEGIQDQEGYRLNPTSRYSHSRPYIEATAFRAGFESIEFLDVVLRKELGWPVHGHIVVLAPSQSAMQGP